MPAHKLVRGLVITFLLFVICIAIRPEGLAANSGLSYYGSFRNVLIPYSLGFFVYAFTYWEVAKLIQDKRYDLLAAAMKVMSALFVGLLVTPHDIIDPIHKIVGVALFVTQLLVAWWLVYKEPKDHVGLILAGLLLISGILADLNLAGNDGFLIQAQIMFQLLFNLTLYRALLKLQQKIKPST